MKHVSRVTFAIFIIFQSTLVVPVPAEISYGELIDKITILRIKQQKISEPKKLGNINSELAILEKICQEISASENLQYLIEQLIEINKQLWEIEDAIRIKEAEGNFDQEFIELARNVYLTNDKRVEIKRAINNLLGSSLQEEKSYKGYANQF